MKQSTEINYQQRILRVLSYINKHLDDELSLEQLAELAYFSPYHFHRIFTQITGESLKEYIRRRKTHRAIMHLGLTDRTITEIAFDAGFGSTEAFSRHIKKHFKVSPREVRHGSQQMLDKLEQLYGDKPAINVEIVEREPTQLAYLLHIGPYEEAVYAWEQIAQLVGLPTLVSDENQCYGIPYDHPSLTDPEKCHYAACISWQDRYAQIDELHSMTLAGGTYAKLVHHGDVANIEETYSQFTRYIVQQDKLDFAESPSVMHYVNLMHFEQPEKQITEIYFPLNSGR
ncbi:MAG: AraC family transcriptional regulator [Coxiellaceae bacterium]|nr:AraC family transcriptional regulator [Coxiellaceae bacterium]